MKPTGLPLLSALSLVTALGGTALAQSGPPTPEQAAALEKQVHDALVSAADGAIQIPARPVEFTPEGDHYLMRVPLGQFGKIEPPDAAFTAQAKLLDGTRWA